MRRIILTALFLLAAAIPSFAAEWTRVENIPGGEYLTVYSHNDVLYAGGQGFIYTKNGCAGAWLASNKISPDADNVAALIVVGNRIFVGVWGEGVFESTDGGTNWIPRNSGLAEDGGMSPMDFAVRGDSLYLATDGAAVHVLNLNGPAAWSAYRDGLGFGIQWNVACITSHDDVLVAGAGANGEISTRSRSENSWQTYRFSDFDQQMLSMRDLLSVGGSVYGVAHNGLYASTDSGQTWEQHLPAIGLIPEGAVCTDGSRVYALAGKTGLFARIFQRVANQWVEVEHIPSVAGYDLAIHCNRLYMARANGLWYRDLDATDVPDRDPVLPGPASLEQNFPNPFNPTTTMSFTVHKPSVVNITVFNVIGQKVAVLLDDYRSAGKYSVEWNSLNSEGESLPAGVYFYRLQIGSFTETRKMVLLK